VAFAAPAAVWYLLRAWRRPERWIDAAAALAGVALPVAAMLWVNARTTGHPFLFGYEVLWGREHDLGFHGAPWGEAHTPARGVQLVSLAVLRLQEYLFETPIPSLVPILGAFALARPLRPADRYLLASGALLVVGYFAYWYDGFYLGPRFVYPLAPILALWAARFPSLIAARLRPWGQRGERAFRVIVYALGVSAAIALGYAIPLRAAQYRTNSRIERWMTPRLAAAAGVHGALVFVREAWEDQVVARLWALGVSRPQAELLYRAVDLCRLDSAVAGVESLRDAGADDGRAFARLAPLLADSAAVTLRRYPSGVTFAVQERYRYPKRCAARLAETMAGTVPLAPLQLLPAWGAGDDNTYVRDLGARDTVLLAEHPAVPLYLVRPRAGGEGSVPSFFPASRDSMWRAARGG
jgi:hypothetical protein